MRKEKKEIWNVLRCTGTAGRVAAGSGGQRPHVNSIRVLREEQCETFVGKVLDKRIGQRTNTNTVRYKQ